MNDGQLTIANKSQLLGLSFKGNKEFQIHLGGRAGNFKETQDEKISVIEHQIQLRISWQPGK